MDAAFQHLPKASQGWQVPCFGSNLLSTVGPELLAGEDDGMSAFL